MRREHSDGRPPPPALADRIAVAFRPHEVDAPFPQHRVGGVMLRRIIDEVVEMRRRSFEDFCSMVLSPRFLFPKPMFVGAFDCPQEEPSSCGTTRQLRDRSFAIKESVRQSAHR